MEVSQNISATHLVITPQGIKKLKNNTKRLHENVIEVEDLFSGTTTIYTISNLPNKFSSKMKFYWFWTRHPRMALLLTFISLLGISSIVMGLASSAPIIQLFIQSPIILQIVEIFANVFIFLLLTMILIALSNESLGLGFALFLATVLAGVFFLKKLAIFLLSCLAKNKVTTPLSVEDVLFALALIIFGITLLFWVHKKTKKVLRFFSEFEIVGITVYEMVPV